MNRATKKTAPVARTPPAKLGLIAFLAAKTVTESRLSLVLLLVAVAAGVAFQMPNVANLAGYRRELVEREVAIGYGDVRVRPKRGERLREPATVARKLRSIPGVTIVEPVLILPGALRTLGSPILTQAIGVSAAAPRRPYQLLSGEPLSTGDPSGVLVGRKVADKLELKVGDEAELTVLLSARPRLVLDDQGVGTYSVRVRGLVGGAGIDRVFVNREFLASEVGDEEAATMMIVHAEDHSLSLTRRIAGAADDALPSVSAVAWFDDSPLLRSTIGAIDALGAISAVMSLFAVSVPVLALLYVDARNRRRQVSLLVAMGVHSGEIFSVFLLKAMMVGVAGVLLGGLGGLGLLAYFDTHPIYSYETLVVRPLLTWEGVVRPMLVVLAATLLAGSYPAWRAARVDPSRMLRRIE